MTTIKTDTGLCKLLKAICNQCSLVLSLNNPETLNKLIVMQNCKSLDLSFYFPIISKIIQFLAAQRIMSKCKAKTKTGLACSWSCSFMNDLGIDLALYKTLARLTVFW